MLAKSRSNIYTFITLFMVIVIDALGAGLIYPILAPIFNMPTGGLLPQGMSVEMRNVLFGITMAAYPFFMFFGSPLLGDLSDHLGRKKVLLICLYGECVGMLFGALAITIHSVTLLIVCRAVTGLLAGSQSIAQASIIDISSKKRKTANISLITLAISFGFILGPLLSGIMADKTLVSWFHYNTPFFAAAFLAFLNATLLIFTFRETFHPKEARKIKLTKGVSVFISAFKRADIRKLAVIYMFSQGAFALFVQFSALYLVQNFAYTITRISHFYIWLASIVALSSLLLIRVAVYFWRLKQFIFYAMLIGVCGAAICLLPASKYVWIGLLPIVIGGVISANGILTLFSDAVDPEEQGWAMGVASASGAFSWAVGAMFAGLLSTLSYFVPFGVVGLLFLLGAVGVIYVA